MLFNNEQPKNAGGVPERSNGTDCKSVASASKVRILLPPLFSFIQNIHLSTFLTPLIGYQWRLILLLRIYYFSLKTRSCPVITDIIMPNKANNPNEYLKSNSSAI